MAARLAHNHEGRGFESLSRYQCEFVSEYSLKTDWWRWLEIAPRVKILFKKSMALWWNWIIIRPYEGPVLGSNPRGATNFISLWQQWLRKRVFLRTLVSMSSRRQLLWQRQLRSASSINTYGSLTILRISGYYTAKETVQTVNLALKGSVGAIPTYPTIRW